MTGIALDHLLTHGARPGTLADLVAAWRMDEIEIRLAGMAGFAGSPSLGNKLRGALGEVLLMSASKAVRERRSCGWRHTSTAEMFFGRRPLIRLGDHDSEITKPYVFEIFSQNDGSLRIVMRIFGAACARTTAVADALVYALRRSVRWRDLARDGPRFLPNHIEPEAVDMAVNVPVRCRDAPGSAELVFVTPLDADRGDPTTSPSLVLERIVRRTALLAPWHGVSLADSYAALVAAAHRIPIADFFPTSVPAPPTGGHHAANTMAPPMTIGLSGPLDPIWPALRIGEAAHIGRGAALGLGRYRIVAKGDR